jgi:radical SAM superfamily enzyme YgiQ (UPF0313 family)
MPRVVFIQPCIGRRPGQPYVRSWQMEPLAIGVLAALTPPTWERVFYDDRMEPMTEIPERADLVAITVETFTARRAYRLADACRRRGLRVALGGFHATLCPGEAGEHADAVCIGPAEGVWPRMLEDALAGRLRPVYRAEDPMPVPAAPDRSMYEGRNYFNLSLVETSRGCPFACRFCSITAFYRQRFRRRPVESILEDVRDLPVRRPIFFVDDNLGADRDSARALFKALVPLRRTWIGQISLDALRDPAFTRLMAESGCAGVLVGFESLFAEGLACMNKRANRPDEYGAALRRLRDAGIVVYGAFMFGLPGDTPQRVRDTVDFAVRERMFLAAFAHLMPFPGTPLYAEIQAAGRLRWPRWWLNPEYRFGQAVHHSEAFTAEHLEEQCMAARRRFFSWRAIAARAADRRANLRGVRRGLAYVGVNALMHRELARKFTLPLDGEA